MNEHDDNNEMKDMNEQRDTSISNDRTEHASVRDGDVIEFTLRGARMTAEVLIVTDGGHMLLDLLDSDRPVAAHLSELADLAVFQPDLTGAFTVAA